MNLPTPEQTIRDLRGQVAYLTEEVRQLRDERLPSIMFPSEWKLRPSGRKILAALYAAPGGMLTRERIFEIASVFSDGENIHNLVGAHVHQLRKCLPDDIQINMVWGLGYQLPAASKAALRAVLEQKVAA